MSMKDAMIQRARMIAATVRRGEISTAVDAILDERETKLSWSLGVLAAMMARLDPAEAAVFAAALVSKIDRGGLAVHVDPGPVLP